MKVKLDPAVKYFDGSTAALRDRGEVGHTRLSKLKLPKERQSDGWPALSQSQSP